MNMISIIIWTALVWFSVAFFDYAQFCSLWQLKEYRLDKFRDFLSTSQGKDFLKSYLFAGRSLMLAFFLIVVIFKLALPLLFVVLIFTLEVGRCGRKIYRRKIVLPKMTLKALAIISLAVAMEFSVVYFSGSPLLFLLIFASRFFILSLAVFLFWIPTKIAKRTYVWLATRKIKKYPKLKVIGITGSYGKTTVKNFLAQILGANFFVSVAPKNINTEIGVAKFILKNDFSQKDIFVVEMGAYKQGEIKTICDMVRPEIGILTAINEQHISLFGSVENIQKTKFELLRSLPKNGLAITNSDSNYCREFLKDLVCKVETFGQEKEYAPRALLSDIRTLGDMSIAFDMAVGEEKLAFKSKVLGGHNAFNIAPCILVAQHFEINMSKIKEKIENLELPEGTLRVFNYGESMIIDDSYNSNPDGFLAALDVLEAYDRKFKKIIITRGMIELGSQSKHLHKKVGIKISQTADELVIISSANEAELVAGINEKETQILKKYNTPELLEYVRPFKESKAVILLENTVPPGVLEELKKNHANIS